ncbi:MAG: hypothetical protein IJA78_04315 [Clostridia bacterium]|nr:hypothetical protein [Clostridia bacterium]
MYDHRPQRQNATAKLAVLALLAAAAIALFGSTLTPKYPAILQAIGIALLIPIIQLSTRYLFTSYLYRLRPYDDGSTDLEIYSYRGGARMQLVCRVGLEEITALTPLTAANKKPPHGLRRYNYCMDIGPRDAQVLSVTNGDGDCEILLVPDKTLCDALAAAANAPKTDTPTEDPTNEE